MNIKKAFQKLCGNLVKQEDAYNLQKEKAERQQEMTMKYLKRNL